MHDLASSKNYSCFSLFIVQIFTQTLQLISVPGLIVCAPSGYQFRCIPCGCESILGDNETQTLSNQRQSPSWYNSMQAMSIAQNTRAICYYSCSTATLHYWSPWIEHCYAPSGPTWSARPIRVEERDDGWVNTPNEYVSNWNWGPADFRFHLFQLDFGPVSNLTVSAYLWATQVSYSRRTVICSRRHDKHNFVIRFSRMFHTPGLVLGTFNVLIRPIYWVKPFTKSISLQNIELGPGYQVCRKA